MKNKEFNFIKIVGVCSSTMKVVKLQTRALNLLSHAPNLFIWDFSSYYCHIYFSIF